MNIITNADVNKFLKLVDAGIKHGRRRELRNYTSATPFEGLDVVKEYYVSIEFSYTIDREEIEKLFAEEDVDVTNKVNELLKGRE